MHIMQCGGGMAFADDLDESFTLYIRYLLFLYRMVLSLAFLEKTLFRSIPIAGTE